MILLLWLVLAGCGLGAPRFSDSHASDHPPLRVLPIGDSYTSGFLSVGGWRPFVHDVDFVGPFCDEVLADCEHGGVSGRRLDAMAPDARAWTATYAPDVVVAWGGYNDLSRGATIEATVDAMAALVEAVGSGSRVIVVTTFRSRDRHAAVVDAYNDALRSRVVAEGWELADVRAATSDDAIYVEVTDGVHPTHRGYEAAGHVIAGAL